jgi:hypothetical protein
MGSPSHISNREEGDIATPASGTRKGWSRDERKLFTSNQMKEMIRNRAFSSGCKSYTQFVKRAEPRRASPKGETMVQLDRERAASNTPSNFGIELINAKEASAWEANSRGLGGRSVSEGALLKYATQAAEEMTRSVKENLGIDVTVTTRREMSKPSFIARLDVGGVSSNPHAQVVRKVGSRDSVRVTLPALRRTSSSSGLG